MWPFFFFFCFCSSSSNPGQVTPKLIMQFVLTTGCTCKIETTCKYAVPMTSRLFQRSRASYCNADGLIRQNFKLVQDFMPVPVTCKFHNDLIKNKQSMHGTRSYICVFGPRWQVTPRWIEPAHEIMVLITWATSEGSGQSVRCSHTWSMEIDEGPTKNQTSSPTGWLRMCVWRMSLWRTKSVVISWDGSICSGTRVRFYAWSAYKRKKSRYAPEKVKYCCCFFNPSWLNF